MSILKRYKDKEKFIEEVMDIKLTPLDKKLLKTSTKKPITKPRHIGKHLYIDPKN